MTPSIAQQKIRIRLKAFETRTHRRIIDIYSPSAKTIDALMKLDLPSGVDIEVKL